MMRSLAKFTGLALLLALPACNQLEAIDDGGDDGGGGGGVPPEVRAAFESSCGITGCHSPGGQTPVLAGAALDSIVGGKATQSSIPLVTLGDTANSYIAIKMLPPAVVASLGVERGGGQMPPGGGGPNPNINIILAWIAGAPFEGGGGEETTGEPPGDPTETGGTTGMPVEATLTEVQKIFNVSCACHLSPPDAALNGNLNFAEGMAYANLVGVKSGQATMLDLVTPMDPENSYLYLKVAGGFAEAGGVGVQMPPGGMLSGDQVALIEEWITAGALDN